MPILKWLTRDEDIKQAGKAEYRLLKENPAYSYGDKNTDNMIIHGDNLEALKALLPFYAGQVKCIYIDPPYNTGSAFEHYDDNLEHTTWLSMMYPRLELLRELLREDGCIFIQIDDNEQAYLKVLMDEIFGRKNFISNIVIKMSTVSGVKTAHKEKNIIKEKEYVLVYAKDASRFKIKPQYIPKLELDSEFQYFLEKNGSLNPDDWSVRNLRDVLMDNKIAINSKEFIEFCYNNSDKIWRRAFIRNEYKAMSQQNPNKIFLITNERGINHFYYRGREMYFLKDQIHECFTEEGVITTTGHLLGDIWRDVNTGKLFNEGGVDFRNSKKPEFLIARILNMVTNYDDIILDSFLGSGTTAAVAHKMGRRYIGVELGEHAKTHCTTRLNMVVDGEQGGISKAVNWQGGGGYRFYELADSVFTDDGHINQNITFEQLSAHLWFYETKTPFNAPQTKSTALGVHNGTAYALLYNGILHDKRVDGGNVLTSKTLDVIKADLGDAEYDKLVIYGEASRLGAIRTKENNIEFKQTPYDIKAK